MGSKPDSFQEAPAWGGEPPPQTEWQSRDFSRFGWQPSQFTKTQNLDSPMLGKKTQGAWDVLLQRPEGQALCLSWEWGNLEDFI